VTITGNSAGNRGGGIFIGSVNLFMTGGSMSGNAACNGGGIYQGGATATFTGVAFQGNYAEDWGGGVYIEGGTLNLNTCNFSGNQAVAGAPKIARTHPDNRPNPIINIANCTGVSVNDIIDVPYGT